MPAVDVLAANRASLRCSRQSVRAQRRYEREVGLSTSDRYQAFHLGTNYLLAGQG